MAEPTVDDLVARYPEFSKADPNQVGLLISEAALEVDAGTWGKFHGAGILALAAHLLALARQTSKGAAAASGQVTGKKAGDIQLNYAAAPVAGMADALLATTVYGQRYLQLRSLVAFGIRVVMP
ncbi:DUF4054 domain-containing protein [Laribacter hongkongensis]|uniref:DUF4054 domain-containing protein n=1 Tax=Laribacter hongkongensis TaxID=168471 RepID=UPI001EFC6D44|nr:DUF4054 domain-containing protein [Laribacter hongkongensis]MCG9064711.1 DUF4054 domain-containing protein [Laribacter hongkongensis]